MASSDLMFPAWWAEARRAARQLLPGGTRTGGADDLDSVYITYWSLEDPLCQSQSLPYLEGLVAEGWRLGLVTFEQAPWAVPPERRDVVAEDLRRRGITWFPLRYHKRPPVISTVYDIARGALACTGLGLSRGVRVFHSRSSVSGAMAYGATRLTRAAFFFDADGPLSEEYVDAGAWKRESLPHRMTRWMEGRCFAAADAAAVLTESRREEVEARYPRPTQVLPCGVDTSRFRPHPHGATLRNELGLHGTVFVYAGKPGGWYLTEPMFDFLKVAQEVFGDISILVLSGDEPAKFAGPAEARGLKVTLRKVPRERMPEFLSAADVGMSFIASTPSKRACSPIKNGEYLACGLPVVSTAGIGDYSGLITKHHVGVVVDALTAGAYLTAAQELAALLAQPGLAERCRAVVREQVGLHEVVLPRYRAIYERLLKRPGSAP